jgi:3-hydroxyisobutyrate dehydrogenase-like beta-hydroxyacid dehydrogenase
MAATATNAIDGAELVIAALTASSALPVAKEMASLLKPGQIYMDVNSVSPETKKKMSVEIAKSGADFVEAAIMAAVKPTRLKTPILIGGTRASELAAELNAMGFETSAASDRIGVASAIKMCRSVVMKGLASLAIESLFTARRYGAEQAVLESFESTYPLGWLGKLPDTLVMRSVEHSKRRAAEMLESAETIRDAGITPRMSVATAGLQDWLTEEMEAGHYTFDPKEPFKWTDVADALNAVHK